MSDEEKVDSLFTFKRTSEEEYAKALRDEEKRYRGLVRAVSLVVIIIVLVALIIGYIVARISIYIFCNTPIELLCVIFAAIGATICTIRDIRIRGVID